MNRTRSAVRTPALLASVALGTALVVAGCGSTSHTSHLTSSPSSSSSTSTAADVTFSTDMISHHQQAVEMAQMVLDRGSNAKVKALAARIKAAQSPEITQMSGFLTMMHAPMPMASASMGSMGHGGHDVVGMMSNDEMMQLDQLSGSALDKSFLELMIKHHEGAVMMSSTELSDGSFSPAKGLATKIKTAQTTEIAEMKALLAQLA